ncbi:hypothetical protein OUZ56_016337 [Daphnia magna]|uniref:Uncharacterized protein n=1 Tax=Daphnia magna TaxID=35525 RepID=A0ABR0AQE7_9CRUS|nr:hypothetical protein OUZ56_016337 [Daphnia magna]
MQSKLCQQPLLRGLRRRAPDSSANKKVQEIFSFREEGEDWQRSCTPRLDEGWNLITACSEVTNKNKKNLSLKFENHRT